MNEVDPGNELPISEADTTPPNPSNDAVPAPGPGWQMPEPKFQKSSGYLPEGYLNNISFEAPPPEDVSPAAAGPATAAAPARAPDPGVEPQPDLSVQLEAPPAPAAAKPVGKERSSASRIVMIVLGLLAMAAFIVLFLAAIYYLFLSPQNGGTTF